MKPILVTILLMTSLMYFRPAMNTPPIHAASDYPDLYIEPGTTTLRTLDGRGQVQGKVVIDRRTGDVWGFPTGTSAPYPIVTMSSEPPHSKPIYLGRFDFAAMKRND